MWYRDLHLQQPTKGVKNSGRYWGVVAAERGSLRGTTVIIGLEFVSICITYTILVYR